MSRPLRVRRLGRIAYAEGVERQKALVQRRQAGEIDDTLLFVEHPPVITLGVKTRGNLSNVRAAGDDLAARGVEIHESGRGGDVTFHGPGQLVGYPIVDLKPDRQDVHRYVRDLEEVLIRTAGDFGIEAGRIKGYSGAWVGDRKLAAIGVRISRWVTSHGFALNVTTDLSGFDLIVPCGITDRGVTSLSALLGRDVAMADVERSVIAHFAAVFDREPVED